jgi:PAS domain S-box-containing protein
MAMSQFKDFFKELFVSPKSSAQYEKELQEHKNSELKFRGLLESAPDAMVITSGDGRILMVNAQTEHIFGYNRNELIGKAVELLIPQRFQGKHVHHREQYVANPKVRAMGAGMALFGIRKNGSEFPVEVSLSPMRLNEDEFMVMSAIRDITKQKETEAEIKKINENLEKLVGERTRELEDALNTEKALRLEMLQNQNRLRLLTEIGGILAFSLDDIKALKLSAEKLVEQYADVCSIDRLGNDGSLNNLAFFSTDSILVLPHSIETELKAVLLNKKAALLNDIKVENITEKCSAIILPLLNGENVYGAITLMSASPSKRFTVKDLELSNEIGRRISTSIEKALLYKELQNVNTDLEQRVVKRTLELEAINKELEAFSYSVSHDLRAPLRSIDGFSNKILKDYSAQFNDQAKDYFNRIMNASRKMGVLIDDLLKLARFSRVEMRLETINLSDIASGIIADFKDSNPERVAETEIQKGMVEKGDRNLVQVALLNLLGNAWKYTKNNPVTKIEFGSFLKDNATVYYIRDNGVGFDMRYVDKLFGAFQRLHSVTEFEGTGIGLATVQRIIRRHHGNIWAESEVNKGSTFYFTLNQ